ncbi:MAG: hypothetical protein IJU23_05500 [Proteobacteria bacterium]|nr:hypothetical protein [Pseudomonadota bacterium]
MKKRLSLLVCVSVSIFALTACHDDNKTSSEPESCIESTYTATCPTSTSYTTCTDGVVVTQNCPNDSTCDKGVCAGGIGSQCTLEKHSATCIGNTHYTECQDGKVISKACEGATICSDGKCLAEVGCSPNKFVSECEGTDKHTVCTDDGKLKIDACPTGTTCKNGECSGSPEKCDVSTHANTCAGTKRLTCNDGLVTPYDCEQDGAACIRGECVVVMDIPCTENSFAGKCIGNTLIMCSKDSLESLYCPRNEKDGICAVVDGKADCYTACTKEESEKDAIDICGSATRVDKAKCIKTQDEKYILQSDDESHIFCSINDPLISAIISLQGDNISFPEECVDNICVCKSGKCVIDKELGTECDAESYTSRCEGDLLYYCGHSSDTVEADHCYDGDKCLTINNKTQCYEPCSLEGETYYDCDYHEKGQATQYTCTRTEKGLFWAEKEVKCLYCHDTIGIYDDGYVGDVCINETCSEDAYGDSCDGKKLTQCLGYSDVTYKYSTDCGTQSCIMYEESSGVCADACTKEDHDKENKIFKCELNLERDNPIYTSRPYYCEKLDEGYYWIEDDKEYYDCRHGCDNNGECKKIHPQEGKNCTKSDTACDGHFALNCGWDGHEVTDCEKACIVDEYENAEVIIAHCVDTCSETEVAAGDLYSCTPFNMSLDSIDVSYSQKCVKIDDNQYAKISSSENCSHGCDEKTGKCIKLHEDEGTPCSQGDDEYCAGDYIIRCGYEGTKMAEDCNAPNKTDDQPMDENFPNYTKNTCIIEEGYTWATCKPACSAEDVDHPVKSCAADRLSQYICTKNGDNYFWVSNSNYCDHGCDANKNECILLHPDEGKECSSSKCGDENILLTCMGGISDTPMYVAENCGAKGMVCGEINETSECLPVACTQDDFENNFPQHRCDGELISNTLECRKYDDGYYWDAYYSEGCDKGCDSATGLCK